MIQMPQEVKLPPSPADGSHSAWMRALTGVLINPSEQICKCKKVITTTWVGNSYHHYEIHMDCCGTVGYSYEDYCKRNGLAIPKIFLRDQEPPKALEGDAQ